MEIRHLRYFLVVAEELHFNRAAELLHMQQPPLSRQIRQLESEVGVELFVRTTRSVHLTEAGKAFAREARAILEMFDRSPQVAVRAARGMTGRLGVGFTGSNTYSLLPLLASQFREQFPDAEIVAEGEMLAPAQEEALLSGRLDACFGRKEVALPEIESRVMWSEPLSVVLSAHHRLAKRTEVDLADLADDPFVTYPSRFGSTMFELTINACELAGFSPRIVQEVTQTSTLMCLVAAGFGVALAPQSVQHIRVTGAVCKPLISPQVSSDLVLAWRRDNRLPLLHRFVDLIARTDFTGALRPHGA